MEICRLSPGNGIFSDPAQAIVSKEMLSSIPQNTPPLVDISRVIDENDHTKLLFVNLHNQSAKSSNNCEALCLYLSAVFAFVTGHADRVRSAARPTRTIALRTEGQNASSEEPGKMTSKKITVDTVDGNHRLLQSDPLRRNITHI